MARYRCLLCAPGLLLLACGESSEDAASVAHSATAAVTFTASPTSGLPFFSAVNVRVSSLRTDTIVMLAQCPDGATHIGNDCFNPLTMSTGASATFEVGYFALREITTDSGQVIDCATRACSLAVAVADAPTELQMIPIAFAPAVPRLTVSPNTELTIFQTISVRVDDLDVPAGTGVVFGQCRATSTLMPGAATPGATSIPPGCVYTTEAEYDSTLRNGATLMQVARRFTPDGEPEVVCDAPGKCVVFAMPELSHDRALAAPITFRPVQLLRGSLTIEPANPEANELVEVRGSGWAPNATVSVGVCGAYLGPEGCSAQTNLQVGADGTFSTRVRALQNVGAYYRFDDCSVPGSCSISSFDTNDREATFASVGYTVPRAEAARGTVDVTLPPALVSGVPMRLVGQGWTPGHELHIMQCKGTELTQCWTRSAFNAGVSGDFRTYVSALDKLALPTEFDCTLAPGSCALVVLDVQSGVATQVRVPLTFSNAREFQVAAHYEPQWENMLQQATSATGIAAPELQKTGVAFTAWVLRHGGARSGTKLPAAGSVSHTTLYTLEEYRRWSQLAAEFDYTLVEMQKIGAVFWSWYLLGMPPLP